jgi:hypothetical protein
MVGTKCTDIRQLCSPLFALGIAMKNRRILFILLSVVLSNGFLNGCSQLQAIHLTPQVHTTGMCINPVVATIPTNMGQHRQVTGKGKIQRESLPDWWNLQPNSSTALTVNGSPDEWVADIAVRDGIAWIALAFHILKYNTETGETNSYKIVTSSNKDFVISDLLIGKNREIWALVFRDSQRYVALARYNPTSDRFEIVSDKDGTLRETGNYDYLSFVNSETLVESTDGKILMPFKKNIIAYNPQSNTVSYLLPRNFPFPVAAIIAFNNKVWFTVGRDIDRGGLELIPEEKDLRSVDLKTGELVDYGRLPTILDDLNWGYMEGSFRPIAVDASGRIWMGYFSRLVPNQNGGYTWEQVTYPPEFVIGDDPDYIFLWARLYSIHTTSSGHLWFISEAGLVEYDPEKDSWCKSLPTNPPMGITEDEHGNMWMAIRSGNFNGIYKKLEEPNGNK